ncbi:MAG: alpha/beta fold hydrolase, partial [Alphaproteobacteria bacterium]
LYCEDFGEGPSILFICGGNLTHKSWDSQVAAFANSYRCVTFDWRGTGASDKPRTGYTAAVATGDVIELIERLGLGPTVLVGHGLGAHLALLAAEAKPALVKGLFLASAAPWFSGERDGMTGGVSEEFYEFIVMQRRGAKMGIRVPYAETLFELGDKWLFHKKQSPGLCQTILDQALEWPQHVLNCYAEDMRSIDHRVRAKSIKCPTVILGGRHDRKQRYEGGVHLARMIPGARLVTLENSCTMGNVEEVDAFNNTLASFVSSLEQQRQVA